MCGVGATCVRSLRNNNHRLDSSFHSVSIRHGMVYTPKSPPHDYSCGEHTNVSTQPIEARMDSHPGRNSPAVAHHRHASYEARVYTSSPSSHNTGYVQRGVPLPSPIGHIGSFHMGEDRPKEPLRLISRLVAFTPSHRPQTRLWFGSERSGLVLRNSEITHA